MIKRTKREEAVGKWQYLTCMDIEEALTGVDFIVVSIP
jgi:alpha-galactosidase